MNFLLFILENVFQKKFIFEFEENRLSSACLREPLLKHKIGVPNSKLHQLFSNKRLLIRKAM